MQSILGNGIYSLPEAARLLGVNSQRVAAWFQGWPGRRDRVFRSDYSGLGLHSARVISFLDLIDAAVCVTLRIKHRVSLHTIRRVYDRLSQQWVTRHPFAREEFYTDEAGRQVFYAVAAEDNERQLIEALDQQHVIPEILLPILRRVEYCGETKLAQVLQLMGRVVADPRRRFGKPIVRDTGMPTSILYRCYTATGSFEQVADWYCVTPADVSEAVAFETEFSGIAA